MSNDLFLVDTNILVYAFEFSDTRHTKAKTLLESCWNGKRTFAITLQNLAEFYTTITKKIQEPLSKNEAENIVSLFLNHTTWKKIGVTETTLKRAININNKTGADFWDAMIVAVMLENGITHIYTENVKDFTKIPGLVVKNPFKEELKKKITKSETVLGQK